MTEKKEKEKSFICVWFLCSFHPITVYKLAPPQTNQLLHFVFLDKRRAQWRSSVLCLLVFCSLGRGFLKCGPRNGLCGDMQILKRSLLAVAGPWTVWPLNCCTPLLQPQRNWRKSEEPCRHSPPLSPSFPETQASRNAPSSTHER